MCPRLSHQAGAVLGAAHDLVALFRQQPRESLPHQQLVLADHDPHGSSAHNRVPAPGVLSSSSLPPTAATRSAGIAFVRVS